MNDDDDLDQLLDEVEKRFCRNVSVEPPSRVRASQPGMCGKGQRQHSPTKTDQPISSLAEDLDTLLDELLEEDSSDAPRQETERVPPGTKEKKNLSSQSGGRKCCPVFTGGSSVKNGVGTATSPRSCDQLRCTSCDFRVLMFDDCEWDLSCDYLFLRNNMPDRQKLGAKLRRRRGFRAYGCQCSWFSTSEPADLRDRPRLTWVCGKHQD
ncbi:cilia- and flagella-associated protein 418 [Brachionichthys hirsutus]|uniref:cilia- and flagella-associated protein 418 n=1 Tax=Brachionichthys hirsutus TaxID=412623 RepID=UPI0036048C12